MADLIHIGNGQLSAAIDPFGAELTHLRDADGRELMTDADPAYWTGRAPILFPVVGRVTGDVVRINGREYPMPKHGFARRSMFTVSQEHESWAVFTLEANTESRRSYPFEFQLRVMFEVVGLTLTTTVEIWNVDRERAMPAQFGFHPAFSWPLPYDRDRADHRILFDGDEPGELRAITPDGFIAAEGRPSPLDGRELRLHDALFANDALVWDPVRSQRLGYGAPDGPGLDIAFPDTPRLGIWTKPGARFVCVEPWHGIADPAGYAGEYRDKPGVFEVAPGEAKRIGMSVTLVR